MTVSNPIGFAKSDQKYECIYAAITNLPPRLRFSRHAIQLVELTNSKAFKRHSGARVLCGVDVDGKQIDEPCFAADLRRLQEGVELKLPSKDGGGTKAVTLKAYVVGLSADYPAAAALLPNMESTGAHVWCRQCYKDFSSGSNLGTLSDDLLRTPAELKKDIARLRALKAAGKDITKESKKVRGPPVLHVC